MHVPASPEPGSRPLRAPPASVERSATSASTRRELLKRSALLGGAAALAGLPLPSCASSRRRVHASELRHACVGVGGMGQYDLAEIASHPQVRIVALCDVDRANLEAAAALHPTARLYTDWRELLEAERGRIDSVNVSIPDHMHASVAATALQQDLHVYCQKPLTHTVVEARRLTQLAERRGAVTQMGIQNRAGLPLRRAAAAFATGLTGPVSEVHVWTDRPAGWWAQGVERPPGSDAIPETLDWDGWLGVAPVRPYKQGTYHAFAWRGWLDFGTGAQGDMACHLMDPVPWYLGLGRPSSVASLGPAPNGESYPEWSEVHYRFPAGNAHCDPGGVHVVWHDGGRKPDVLLAQWGFAEAFANAALFVGRDGALLVSPYEDCRFATREGEQPLSLPELQPYSHWHEWVEACFGRGEAGASFAYAGPLTEIALLGNVALHYPGATLEFDAEALRFPRQPDADALLHRHYRRGWSVPGLQA